MTRVDSEWRSVCCGFEAAADVITDFALSREQMVYLCREVDPNTDLNLISEVRLAVLNLRGARRIAVEDPHEFLNEHSRYDLGSYMPSSQIP